MDLFIETLTVVGAVFTAVTVLSTFGRFYARRVKGAEIGADDAIIIFDNALVITLTVIFTYGSRGNIARDSNYRLVLVSQLLTFVLLGSVKVAVLLFYKRVFENRRFHLISNILIAVTVAWTVVYFCLLLRYPLFMKWHQNDPPAPINTGALIFTFFVWDVILDIAVLSLPAPMISRLNLNWRRKVLLCAVFLMGAFATIASFIRLIYLGRAAVDTAHGGPLSPAAVANGKGISIWTVLDGPLTVIAANLPVLGIPTNLKQKAKALLRKVSTALSRRTRSRVQSSEEDDGLPPAEVVEHVVSDKATQQQQGSVDGRKWRHMWQAINRDEEVGVSQVEASQVQMSQVEVSHVSVSRNEP